MSRKETFDRAYGNIPKEPIPYINLDWVGPPRSVKYYWLKLVRFITRVGRMVMQRFAKP